MEIPDLCPSFHPWASDLLQEGAAEGQGHGPGGDGLRGVSSAPEQENYKGQQRKTFYSVLLF